MVPGSPSLLRPASGPDGPDGQGHLWPIVCWIGRGRGSKSCSTVATCYRSIAACSISICPLFFHSSSGIKKHYTSATRSTSFYSVALFRFVLCIALLCTALLCFALLCIDSLGIASHCIVLLCFEFLCIALHYTAPGGTRERGPGEPSGVNYIALPLRRRVRTLQSRALLGTPGEGG